MVKRSHDEETRAGQHALQAELDRHKGGVRALIAGSKVGGWTWNLETDEVGVDERWLEMFGYDSLDAPGSAFAALVHPDDVRMLSQQVGRYLGEETASYECRFRLRHGDGHWVWVESRGQLLEAPDSSSEFFIVGTHADITDLVAMEEQQRRTHRMDAVAQMAGGVAHEFNNLMAIVLGNLDLLGHRLASLDLDDPGIEERVRTIRRSSQRAAEVTQQLLGFASESPTLTGVVNINDVLAPLLAIAERRLPENVEFDVKLAQDLWMVEADQQDVIDATLNLILNAVAALPDGGTIRLGTLNCSSSAACPHSLNLPWGEHVVLYVSDNGVGMSPEVKDRVFDPYFTTRPAGTGTGLGLTMVYGFVNRSNGSVFIDSEVGKGSTFEMVLARTFRSRDRQPIIVETVAPAASPSVILVVDDEPDMRDLLRARLEEAGHVVLAAPNGPTALAVLSSRPGVQLVVSDIVMPGGLDGFELAEVIATRFPQLPVILSSGYFGPRENDRNMPILPKPYDRTELMERVNSALSE